MKIERAVEHFLLHCQYEKNLTGKTLYAYRIDLSQFTRFLREDDQLQEMAEIGKDQLRAYLHRLRQRTQPKTVKRKFATLSALFRFLEREDAIPVSPFRKLQIRITLERRLPLVLTLGDIQRLWAHLYQAAQAIGPKPSARGLLVLRDVAIFEMLFATGMRVAELAGLQPRNVDLEEGTVRIFGKGRKERLIPLCEPDVLSSLSAYRAFVGGRGSHFFLNYKGRAMTEEAVRTVVKKHTVQAGLTKKVTPHTLRHTVATLLMENGVNLRYIQQLLGHSSIVTTQLYARVNSVAQREALGRNHPRKNIHIPAQAG